LASTSDAPDHLSSTPARVSPLYDPRIRGIVYQLALLAFVGFLIYEAATNAIENLRAQKIASGFGFLSVTSGFDVNQKLIAYDATSTYGRAFLVGLYNTLLVGILGIILATFLGFFVGVARLSKNWLVGAVARFYVEVMRNLPLLLQLYFWYNAVLKAMPAPRQSWALPQMTFGTGNILSLLLMIAAIGIAYAVSVYGRRTFTDDLKQSLVGLGSVVIGIVLILGVGKYIGWPIGTLPEGLAFINNRGIILPDPVFGPGAGWIGIAAIAAVVGSLWFRYWARKKQAATGLQYPVGLVAIILVIGLPVLAYFLSGRSLTFTMPVLRGFNFQGGLQIFPEFVALLVGLATYTAAFIAEIVRAGIVAVSKGQTEAANALGLRNGPTLKLVVIPQAMRVIIPPLTSQYLNLMKNSSLAVAIGYPDLVQVFTGTVLNQTGQAVEVVAITMAVYLTISVVTSFSMNVYNRRVALVER
jgi:general L-amino acid transport system permease protein